MDDVRQVFGPEWLGYELRRVGRIGLLTPVLVVVVFALFALPMAFFGADRGQVAELLSSVPEVFLPILAGLVAATVVTQEPALDLHLTLKTSYRRTVARRLTLLFGFSVAASFVWTMALRVLGLWSWPGWFSVSQMGWIVPLVWFVSAAVLLALVLRSRVASGAILGGVWLFQNLLGGVFFTYEWLRPFYLFPMSSHKPVLEEVWGERYWADGWPVLGAMALLMTLAAALLLGNSERMAGEGDA